MDFKRLSQIAVVLSLASLANISYADNRGEVLLGLSATPKTVEIQVASGGCTGKGDFRVDLNSGGAKTAPYSITFHRTRNDDCKAFLPDGVQLSFTREELGLTGTSEFIVTNRFGNTSQHRVVNKKRYNSNLAQPCLDATRQAINMDIQRYQGWIKQATTPERRAEQEKGLARLNAERQRYEALSTEGYQIPEKRTLTGQYQGNQILFFDGQSKSGPFYHVVASAIPLKSGSRYAFEFYPVYPRVHPFPSHYIYVSKADPLNQQ